ncbi:50S ribosomal protein L30e [Candidatus Micrarchaeota archaeon]|nr:50S ribosomal protein L30e [Candidatus Micrarchaeota archaeon]
MDVNVLEKNIRLVYDTGKISYGEKVCKRLIMAGKGKLIILANDCPKNIKNDVVYYSEMSQIPIAIYPNSALRLGETCGRPHPISIMIIEEEGDSKIIDVLTKKEEGN